MILKALKNINTRGILAQPGDKFSVNDKFGVLLIKTKAAEPWKDPPTPKKKGDKD